MFFGGEGWDKVLKVCILISVQRPNEVRVFHREARTLQRAGYDVDIVAQDDYSYQSEGINVIAIGAPKNRLHRMLRSYRLFFAAIRQNPDIYHIHNPELLFWGVLLHWTLGKPVVYDVHECFKDAVMLREWIPRWIRKPLSIAIGLYEKLLSRAVSYTVTADIPTAGQFTGGPAKVSVLFNYPILEYYSSESPSNCFPGEPTLVHAGSITRERGSDTLIEAVKLLLRRQPKLKVLIIGSTGDTPAKHFVHRVRTEGLSDTILFTGTVDHRFIPQYLRQAHVGLSLLEDVPKFQKNIPQKVFEYLASGLPVVATALPPLIPYALQTSALQLVRPGEPAEVAGAIDVLISNPALAKRLGEEGRDLVLQKYNWENESAKLIALYANLTGKR